MTHAPDPALAQLLTDCETVCHAGSLRWCEQDGSLLLSDGLCELLGLGVSRAASLDDLTWIPENERRLIKHLWLHASFGEPFEIRHRAVTADGRTLNMVHRGLRTPSSTEHLAGHAVLVDVSGVQYLEQRLEELTHVHETTGLPNRTWLINRLENAVASSGGDGRQFTVVSIAVPRITELASSMGFGAADALATAIAARLSEQRREDEWVAQLGADEFALVIRHRADRLPELTRARLAELRVPLQAPVTLGSMDIFPSLRAGASVFPNDGGSAMVLLEAAQAARQAAASDDDLAFHSPQSTARALRDIQIESRLRQAMAQAEFGLAYQPQVCLKTGVIKGVEALLRWQPGQGDTYEPEEFLPVAERTGLIAALGTWVIQEACAQVVRWRQQGVAIQRTAINLSPVQFQIGDVEQVMQDAMARTGALPSEIALEVTESALLHDATRVANTLRKLQQSGIEIALDDFGTGYSSLSRLRSLPIDVLKIDRAFIQDVTAEADSAAVVRGIIHLAHSLRIQVMAEGIETEGQLSMVLGSGCDLIQGYYFAQPVGPEQVAEMVFSQKQLPPEFTLNYSQRRTLLLVDDEENILSALKRLFRRDGYRVLTANSGMQALELLSNTEVDVIISDQRMPGMAGVDFLRKAKDIWPDTIRMTLSGFTDLQSIIDAVNEGAVFKFLTKPWDDNRLREHVAQAFRQKGMADENRRLSQKLASASAEQATLNRRLEALIERQRVDADLVDAGSSGVRDLLDHLPAAVVGVDPEGCLAYLNQAACQLFPGAQAQLGMAPQGALQRAIALVPPGSTVGSPHHLQLDDLGCLAWRRPLDEQGPNRGDLFVFLPESAQALAA